MVIDIDVLGAGQHTPDVEVVWKYVSSLRAQRADPGQVCTLRTEDVVSLVRVLGRTPASICAELGSAVVDFSD